MCFISSRWLSTFIALLGSIPPARSFDNRNGSTMVWDTFQGSGRPLNVSRFDDGPWCYSSMERAYLPLRKVNKILIPTLVAYSVMLGTDKGCYA